jgi:CxxC motif-containing protein
MTINMICTLCPSSCELLIINQAAEVFVENNLCPRGAEFAAKEIRNPERILTTTMPVAGGEFPLVSVRSSGFVKKSELRELVQSISQITVTAPIQIGQVLVSGLGANKTDIIATCNVKIKGLFV